MISKYDCLIKPILTEKTMNNSTPNVYVFDVHVLANKLDIKKSVEEIFSVKVKKVCVLNRAGKKCHFKRREGQRANRKIAIVRLSEGTVNYEGGF